MNNRFGPYINCSDCPKCKDVYPPDVVDYNGHHFCICGMGGNMVYTSPRKVKKISGSGWIHYPESSCSLYKTFQEAWNTMTEPEKERYKAKNEPQITIFDILEAENAD